MFHLNLNNELNILCYLEPLFLMLISNLYVSIFTDFVTSNLLIVIILSDLHCSFQNVFIYLFIIYVLIYYIFIYLFLFIYFCFRLL